ncbi:hypothetical protein DMENIID0001_025840 [Sergentomyia squamirostris]
MMENSNNSAVSAMKFNTLEDNSKVSRTIPHCTVCKEAYSFPSNQPAYLKHLPVLLSCGHVICETCLWHAKSRHFIKCPTCNTLHKLQYKRKFSEQFEFNFYIYGLNKFIASEEKTPEPKSPVIPKCGECSNPVADRKCIQCDSLYCYECFKKIHNFSNVLRTHQTVDLVTSLKFAHTPINCDIHPGKQVNYYCETCEKALCLDCKNQTHLIHEIVQLYDKNVITQKEIPNYTTLLNQLQQLNDISLEVSAFFCIS